MPAPINIDINQPRYDQATFTGRAKHFFQTTNPLNIFASSRQLENAKSLVDKYRLKQDLPSGTTEEDLWEAKVLYDSAFHPYTGEKMFLLGRMSFQVPGNMMITGGMMAFYKSTTGVVFWQWLNQSFNAIVNYTNRSGDEALTNKQLFTSYVVASTTAVATALGLNHALRNAPPLLGRLSPLVTIIVANFVNIPIMRSRELRNGVPVFDNNDNLLGNSKVAAQIGIMQVIFSRVCIPIPSMGITPVIINYLEKEGVLRKYPSINMPANVVIVGFCLTFATPIACAFFKQKAQISVQKLEPELRESIFARFKSDAPDIVYYNKGL